MNSNSTQVNVDEDEVFRKRVESYKKEIEYKKNEIVIRTNEINELVSSKLQSAALKKELERIIQDKDRLEVSLKHEQSKNELHEKKIEQLEEKFTNFCKNSEFQNQTSSKKIKQLEGQLQNEKDKSLRMSKTLIESKDSEIRLKQEHSNAISILKTNKTTIETKFNTLDSDHNKLKEDYEKLQKELSEKTSQLEKEISQKENELKAFQNDLQILQLKYEDINAELKANLTNHMNELTALGRKNEIELENLQIKFEKQITDLSLNNLKEFNDFRVKIETDHANLLKKINEEKDALEIALNKLKEEHEIVLNDLESNKNMTEAAIYYFKNENSLLRYKLKLLTDFLDQSATSFKRSFDEINSDVNSLTLETFQKIKKLKEETIITETEKGQ